MRDGEDGQGRRRRVVRWLSILLASAAVAAGLLGTLAYLENYDHHRGFTAVAMLPDVTPGRLLTVKFYSPAVKRESDYQVYLPTGYVPGRRYPVMYLLHGTPGTSGGFTDVAGAGTRLDNLIKRRQVPPMLLVFPDGLLNGDPNSDAEWANTPAAMMENYVIDVVRDVDHRFSTVANRGARVIAGNSEGGYGAINIALHHLSVFGAVQSWSGYFLQTRSGVFGNASPATLAYNSPLEYVRGLRAQLTEWPLHVFIYGGVQDQYSAQVHPMVKALRVLGVAAGYAIYPGGHDWQLWNAHLNRMLILAGDDVRIVLHGAAQILSAARPRTLLSIGPRRSPAGGHRRPTRFLPSRRASARRLVVGLLLALFSAVLINLGFLLQHRGLAAMPSAGIRLRSLPARLVRNRVWLGGQVLGSLGFAMQIVAVAIALLSLVQAFAAGGLAVSVPLAARLFGHRISRRQVLAVLVIAASLSALPLGLASGSESLRLASLWLANGALLAAGAAMASVQSAPVRAGAAGLLYGAADVSIKAVTVISAHNGSPLLRLIWVGLAVAGTFGGFLSLQAALRSGNPVSVISLMTGASAIAALGCGVVAFGESLGRSPAIVGGHLVAVGLLLACVPALAAAQSEMSQSKQEPKISG